MSAAISQHADRMAASSSTTSRCSLPVRSTGRDIESKGNVTEVVIAIVRRFLPGRIEELRCLLYRQVSWQLSPVLLEDRRRPRRGGSHGPHPVSSTAKRVFSSLAQLCESSSSLVSLVSLAVFFAHRSPWVNLRRHYSASAPTCSVQRNDSRQLLLSSGRCH